MARPAFGNIAERFLPSPAQRPDLVFGAPWIQYVNNRSTLNAGAEILDATVDRVGRDRLAIIDADREESWTYGRLQDEVNRLGHSLLGGAFRPGDRVLLRLPDVPEAAVAQLAVWKVGGIAVPSSVLERARELEFLLNDTEASVAIVHAEHLGELEKVRAACPHLKEVIAVPESEGHYTSYRSLQTRPAVDLPAHSNQPLDGASIFYTGGTTGHPKGCLHTHAAEVVLADLNIMARDAAPNDIFFSHAPIGHAAGNGEKVNFPFRAGSSAIFAVRPSPRRVWELAQRYRASIFLGAATMFRMMLRDAPEPRREFPDLALRFALSSAEVLDQRTFETWSHQMGFEMCNVVGMVPFRHIFIHPAWMGKKVAPGRSVGQPLPGYDIRLVGEDGAPVPPGDVGRAAVRGPTGITYWTNLHPGIRERAKIDVVDGWSICDDAYHRDLEGYLWFESRLDDMIVTAGSQVAAPEVELILKQHEAVADVAVVAAPDEIRGQVVMAYIVLRDGFAADRGMVQSLQEFAKREMAPYKYPRLIQFIPELPKDEYGKIQRRRLRDQAAGRTGALPGKA